MTEHTEQTTTQPGGDLGRIRPEDLIEAVTHGIARTLAAEEDEVSGYMQLSGGATYTPDQRTGVARPPITVGIFLPPTARPT